MSEALTEPDIIDRAEAELAACPPVVCPVMHHFFPGLYAREIFMPRGTGITSMEHLTEHPFFVASGKVEVISANEGGVIYEAPYMGRTLPHTRRMLRIIEDCVWITFHANPDDETDPEKIGARILSKRVNPLLGADHPRLHAWKNQEMCPALEFKPFIPIEP